MQKTTGFTIIFIPPLSGLGAEYQVLGSAISEGNPMLAKLADIKCHYLRDCRLSSSLDVRVESQPKTLDDLAGYYAKSIQELDDENVNAGNYIVIGHSFGGAVAAKVLKKLGALTLQLPMDGGQPEEEEKFPLPKHMFVIDTPHPRLTHAMPRKTVAEDVFKVVANLFATVEFSGSPNQEQSVEEVQVEFAEIKKRYDDKIQTYLTKLNFPEADSGKDKWSERVIEDLLDVLDIYFKEMYQLFSQSPYTKIDDVNGGVGSLSRRIYDCAIRPNIRLLLSETDFDDDNADAVFEQCPMTVVTTRDSVDGYTGSSSLKGFKDLESLGWPTDHVVVADGCDHDSILVHSALAPYFSDFISTTWMLEQGQRMLAVFQNGGGFSEGFDGEDPQLKDMLRDVALTYSNVVTALLVGGSSSGAYSSAGGLRKRPSHEKNLFVLEFPLKRKNSR